MFMKQVTTNNRTMIFVEVPEDAYGFYIHYASEHLEFYRSKGFIQISKIKVGYDRKFIATTDTIPSDLGITDTLLAEHGITGRHAIIEVL